MSQVTDVILLLEGLALPGNEQVLGRDLFERHLRVFGRRFVGDDGRAGWAVRDVIIVHEVDVIGVFIPAFQREGDTAQVLHRLLERHEQGDQLVAPFHVGHLFEQCPHQFRPGFPNVREIADQGGPLLKPNLETLHVLGVGKGGRLLNVFCPPLDDAASEAALRQHVAGRTEKVLVDRAIHQHVAALVLVDVGLCLLAFTRKAPSVTPVAVVVVLVVFARLFLLVAVVASVFDQLHANLTPLVAKLAEIAVLLTGGEIAVGAGRALPLKLAERTHGAFACFTPVVVVLLAPGHVFASPLAFARLLGTVNAVRTVALQTPIVVFRRTLG